MGKPIDRTFPKRTFLFTVGVLCFGFAVTAWYGYYTLSRLSVDYLRNRGHEVAAAIDAQVRGPNIRNNPQVWQSTIEETLRSAGNSLAFISLFSQTDMLIAGAGAVADPHPSQPSEFVTINGTGVYIFELPLAAPRQAVMMGTGRYPIRLRIGLYTSSADFIKRQAILQLAVAGVAIVTLLILAFYFLRTLDRFLVLEAREQSERRLRSIGAMAATLAHEIRNPLGAMKGLTQLAQEELPGEHNAQALMNTVVGEAERLERLVTDLLTFARPFQPEFRTFDLAHLFSEIKAMLQTKLNEAGISLEISPGAESMTIVSDESGLRQVLLNVLLNALEVTSGGGGVSIRAKRNQGTQELILEVDDTGLGLGDRDPEELFQPFTTTKTHGTGLGLAVSRQIVERLGGTIRLANRAGGGARCTIRLPMAPQSRTMETRPAKAGS